MGNLSSPQCTNVNVMGLFNNTKRRRRSHGHRSYNKLIIHDVSFDWLLPHVNKELGLHYICTKLYAVPLKALNNLLEKVKEKPLFDFSTPEYRLRSMIMDIAYHRLFKPTQTENTAHTPRYFFKLQFANKGIDAVNISKILNHKS